MPARQDLDYKALANDLRVAVDEGGGFVFVHLYDADDYDTFLLGEDEILTLHEFLGNLIKEKNL